MGFGISKEPFSSFISRWPEEIPQNLKAKLHQLLVGGGGGGHGRAIKASYISHIFLVLSTPTLYF